jgi:plasmid stabilization system protein ParE
MGRGPGHPVYRRHGRNLSAASGNAQLGRACDYIKPGLRRMESGRHVIFYRIDDAGVLVTGILHAGMIPGPYLQED